MVTKILSRKGVDMERKTLKRSRAVKARQDASPNSVEELFESIAELGREVPPEIRAKVPTDFAKNIDHYLYGAPKVA